MTVPAPEVCRAAPLVVGITHEPFLPWFTITYDNGKTEELDHQGCLDWFKAHGAKDMEAVNDAINQAFNFHAAVVTIRDPVTPATKTVDANSPKI
jgi:hypothetical protein